MAHLGCNPWIETKPLRSNLEKITLCSISYDLLVFGSCAVNDSHQLPQKIVFMLCNKDSTVKKNNFSFPGTILKPILSLIKISLICMVITFVAKWDAFKRLSPNQKNCQGGNICLVVTANRPACKSRCVWQSGTDESMLRNYKIKIKKTVCSCKCVQTDVKRLKL